MLMRISKGCFSHIYSSEKRQYLLWKMNYTTDIWMQDNCPRRRHQLFIPPMGGKRWNKSVLLLWLWPSMRCEPRFVCTVFIVKADGVVFRAFKLINANRGKCECLEAPDISSSGRNTKSIFSFLSDKVATKLLGLTSFPYSLPHQTQT